MHLRRIFAAPDDPHEVIATCNRGYVPLARYNPATRRLDFAPYTRRESTGTGGDGEAEEEEGSAAVRLPFPATDLSWCPAKAGADNACFLTASTGMPLQLWDAEDGELRGNYVAANDTGNHAHPRCCGWLQTAAGQLLAIGGYGGHEDRSPVRFFDILREGAAVVYAHDTSYHAGASSRNNAVTAVASGPRGFSELALAGYRDHATVDVIDVRHRCPAAVLRGGRGGIRAIRCHPSLDHLVFASGGRGKGTDGDDDRVLCWDLRKPSEALATLSRGPALTHQVCDFAFVAAPEGSGGVTLVSASSAGGLRVFDLSAALHSPTVVEGRSVLAAELGATSGLAALERLDRAGCIRDSAGAVAVVVGARAFTFPPGRSHGSGRAAAKRPRPEASSACPDPDDDENELTPGVFLNGLSEGRRALAPLPSDDDDEDGLPTAADDASGANVVVVTFDQLRNATLA